MKQNRKFEWYMDALNLLACLMVVFFHCNSVFYSYSDTVRWKIALIERCIVCSAVPIFFMLSGANLMGYRAHYDTKTFFKKRLARTAIPFLFWNIFYIFYLNLTHQFNFHTPRADLGVSDLAIPTAVLVLLPVIRHLRRHAGAVPAD